MNKSLYPYYLKGLRSNINSKNPYSNYKQFKNNRSNWNKGRFLAWQKGHKEAKKNNFIFYKNSLF